jgi:acetylornithine/N-succinyldiaminopimelate aminotransferase
MCNSGAEACEGAIKLAARYHFANGHPERWRIITFKGAFHGRTLATIAAAGNEKYLEGFGQPAPGFDLVPFGDLEAVEKAIGPETAAIMIEPVQGEGGVKVGSNQFLKACASCATTHGLSSSSTRCNAAWGAPASCSPRVGGRRRPDVMAVPRASGRAFPWARFWRPRRAAKGHGGGDAWLHRTAATPLAMAVGQRRARCGLDRASSTACATPGLPPQAGARPRQGREPRRRRGGARQRAAVGIKVKPPMGEWWAACMEEKAP